MARPHALSPIDRGLRFAGADDCVHSPVGDRVVWSLWLSLALVGACAYEEEAPYIGESEHSSVVGDHASSACSTEVVLGLSRQIAKEVVCLSPDSFVRFEESDQIVFAGSAVLPYLTPAGKSDLEAAVAARGGELRINSAFRTLAQQYLLVRWHAQGRCGITAAAPVGQSNHETGRALDIGNWGDWVGALGDHGWGHTVPGDEVHFDHLASPDLRGYDVLAFQRLWNRNHAGDQIDEDGLYGPQTEARLVDSPAEGFAIGACGGQEPYDAEPVASEVPDRVTPGGRARVVLRIENTGAETWRPGATFLGTSAPRDRDSALHDPESWVSPTRAATVAAETPSGEVGEFAFDILAPDEEQMLSESFKLVEEGVSWFGPAVDLEILVSSDPQPDPDDPDPPTTSEGEAKMAGGCSAAGAPAGGSLAVVLLLAVGFAARRLRPSPRGRGTSCTSCRCRTDRGRCGRPSAARGARS